MNTTLSPGQVHEVLSRYMLTDGYDMVLDLEKSKTPYLYDSKNDKQYLDFFTFFASNPLGMNHPKVADNTEFTERIKNVAIHNPSNSDIYTKELAEVIDTFSRVGIPKEMKHLFFVAGGGLAVENALKVAFDWKVQKNFQKGYRSEKGHKILHFDQAFHGRTGYTMSLTNTEITKVAYFPKFDWPRIRNPKMKFPQDEESLAETKNNEKAAIAQAERYFEIYKDDIAAIIIEPIQGEGGDNQFRVEFHKELRRLADEHEALLIHDEVQTGIGLTGKFWCHEHYVQPDILAFGKKAQVCGILANDRVDEIDTNVFNVSSRINSTWGGNLVDMIRFQRILEVIEEDNLIANAADTGKHLLQSIEKLTHNYQHLSNPRGKGLMCAFDFNNPDDRGKFLDKAYENNLIILPCGDRSIRFRPPLTVSRDHIDEGMEIIGKSLEQSWKSNGRN
ncbi:MAG: L-lysine 6-transaminase [Balneolales bacterium]